MALLLMVLFCIRCTTSTEPDTFSENRLIIGTLLKPDGKQPARDIPVYLIPRTQTASLDAAGTGKTLNSMSVLTDRDGTFRFTSPSEGVFVIEGRGSSGLAVRIDSVIVQLSSAEEKIAPHLLRETGGISGSVILENGDDPVNVFVLAFGSDRFVQADDNGAFHFTDLPYGTYDLKVVCLLDQYEDAEMRSVEVVPGEITAVSEITLSPLSPCTPQNLTGEFDAVMQTVTLTWDACEDETLLGYNIYQEIYDDNNLLNSIPVQTTTFRDNFQERIDNLLYYVVAVSDNGMISEKSTPCIVERKNPEGIDTLPLYFSDHNGEILDISWTDENSLELISLGEGLSDPVESSTPGMQIVSNIFSRMNNSWSVQSSVLYPKDIGYINDVYNNYYYCKESGKNGICCIENDSTYIFLGDSTREILTFYAFDDGFIAVTAAEEKQWIEYDTPSDCHIGVYDSKGSLISILEEYNSTKDISELEKNTLFRSSDNRFFFPLASTDDTWPVSWIIYNPVTGEKNSVDVPDGSFSDINGNFYVLQRYPTTTFEIHTFSGQFIRRIPRISYERHSRKKVAINDNGDAAYIMCSETEPSFSRVLVFNHPVE